MNYANRVILLMAAVFMGLPANLYACNALPSQIDSIIKDSKNNIILVGEYHGTRESPEKFYQLICNVVKNQERRLVVGIELLEGQIIMDGDAKHLESSIQNSEIWRSQHDGKTSLAMYDLLVKLNELVKADTLDVLFFESEGEQRDLEMSEKIIERISEDNLIIALTGNRHNKIKHGNSWDLASKNMGAYIKESGEAVVSINLLQTGGTAWFCESDCKVHKLRDRELPSKGEVFNADEKSRYEIHWLLGKVSSSLPKIFQKTDTES